MQDMREVSILSRCPGKGTGMSEAAVIAKFVFVMIGAQVTGYSEGTGAFYAEGVMERVCRHRVSHGWR